MAAVEEDRLALLPVERVLGGKYTAAEIEERTGVPAARWSGSGGCSACLRPGPDERAFSDEESRRRSRPACSSTSGLGEEAIVEITRVLGEGMARLAATTPPRSSSAFLEPGDTEEDVGKRFSALAEELMPAIEPGAPAAYRAHSTSRSAAAC